MPEIEHRPRTPLDEIMERLDELTPYYRRRMSSLSPQQRRAVCALARLGRAAGSGEIARESRLEPRAAATALTRLKAGGTVEHSGRRWQLSDPWLGAWYRTRRGGPGKLGEPPAVSLPPAPSGWDEILLAAGESLAGEPSRTGRDKRERRREWNS